jgi:hypothetical protein
MKKAGRPFRAAPLLKHPARKRFFFEKRTKKLSSIGARSSRIAQRREKFFGSFFQKRTTSFSFP